MATLERANRMDCLGPRLQGRTFCTPPQPTGLPALLRRQQCPVGRGRTVRAHAAMSETVALPAQKLSVKENAPVFEYGELDIPSWVGENPISWLINGLIDSPLYPLMKSRARKLFIGQAEQSAVPWSALVEELKAAQSELERHKKALENTSIQYPDYYLKPIHAYPQGNLCWDAAYEVEPASMRLYVRTINWAKGILEAEQFFRGEWLEAIQKHHAQHSGGLPASSVLDVGCSVGISTRSLARAFPGARVIGLDASAFYLAVAAYRSEMMGKAKPQGPVTRHGADADAVLGLRPNPLASAAAEARGETGGAWAEEGQALVKRIEWMHALGENTGLTSNSISVVSQAFVVHECPAEAIQNLILEAHRILQPGGTFSFTDNDPRSKVIQSIPSPVAALLKTTEPHSDSFYMMDIEGFLASNGFRNVTSVLCDPRHRVVSATKC